MPPSLCGAPASCGGELFGRWRAVESCADLEFVGAALPCDDLVLLEQTPLVHGFKTYTTQGFYSSSLSYLGSVRMFVPESCLERRVSAATCGALERALLGRGELLLAEVSCAASVEGCSCDASLIPFERETAGKFTARDGRLSEESGVSGDYCVQGDALWVSSGPLEQLVFTRE